MIILTFHPTVRCVRSKVQYFAKRLHNSMAGLGTNDKTLIRIVVSRSEIDLGDIKEAFQEMYGKSLESWIKVNIVCFFFVSSSSDKTQPVTPKFGSQ